MFSYIVLCQQFETWCDMMNSITGKFLIFRFGNLSFTSVIVIKKIFFPLFSFRPDRQLQDIVYKMVPFLEECKYMYMQSHVFNIIGESNVAFILNLFSTAERDQMCNFYKERGLEVPKPGEIAISNLHYVMWYI